MKKFYSLLLSIVLSFTLNVSVSAETPKTTTTFSTERLQNSYIYEITTTEDEHSTYVTKEKTVSRTATCKNQNGTSLWSMTLTATFRYNGTTSSCTNSKVSTKIYDTNWRITNKTSSHSKNTATAKVVATFFKGNTASQTKTKTLTLTCSKTGVIS